MGKCNRKIVPRYSQLKLFSVAYKTIKPLCKPKYYTYANN